MMFEGSNLYKGAVQARSDLWWRRFKTQIIIGSVIVSLSNLKVVIVIIFLFYMRSWFV